MIPSPILTALFSCFATSCLLAGDWSQWRGPTFNGASTETNLPARWSTNENVRWITPLPGQAASTPVTWGKSIFLSSPDSEQNLLLLCVDAESGKEKWRQTVSEGNRDKGRNNMVSPSPVADAERVYVMFATGDLVAFDHAGKQVWKRSLGSEYGPLANMWIYGSSPMLHEGQLFIQVLQRSPVPPDYTHAQGPRADRESFLLCLDPRTGKNQWRHVRKTEAVNEAQEAYTTPVPFRGAQGWEILVFGANHLTAHDPADGKELWRSPDLNTSAQRWWRVVPSPVAAGDRIVVCAPKREPVFALTPGKGVPPDKQIAWKFTEFPSDCVTPLFYGGQLYVLDGDRQTMTCFKPNTGEKIWQGNLQTREIFRASPLGADGKIYCISENGTVVVLRAGAEFKILESFSVGGSPVRSSIIAANGRLLVRTGKELWCVEKNAKSR
jgi:outer membrane protein assembly factor BamB